MATDRSRQRNRINPRRRPHLWLLALLSLVGLCRPAAGQSLGMLLEAGLVPGLGGELLRLAEGPITGGEGVDLAVLPPEAEALGGLLLGSAWGDLVFYAQGSGGIYQPPQLWLGANPAQWQWPPVARQVSPEIADWDGDGSFDLLVGWGDLLLWYPRLAGQLGAGRPLRTAEGKLLTKLLCAQLAEAGHLAPCVGDLDADGQPDLLLGAEDGSVWWARNLAEQGFALASPQRVMGPTGPVEAGARARVSLGDLTEDGRADLLVGNARGDLTLWPGMPTGLGPAQLLAFRSAPDPPLSTAVCPRWLPGEGQILIGEGNGLVRSLAINSEGKLADRGYLLGQQVPLDVGSGPAISVVDEDGDDRLDLLAGEAGGRVYLYRNQATGTGWDLQPGKTLRNGGEPVTAEGGYAWPLLIDADGDGDLDLLLGTGTGRVELWMRAGELIRGAPLTAGAGPIQAAGPATLATGDWDANGKLDLFIGCLPQPPCEAANLQVRFGQVAYFENEAPGRVSLPVFNKGTPLDVYWRRAGSEGTLGRLTGLSLRLIQPLPGPQGLTRFLGLGAHGTFLFECESRAPYYPVLTLTVPGSSPPSGLLPTLYSIWVTADADGQPEQVLCGIAEYGMVCVFSAESLGLR